jgi:hypothetical protein
LELNIKMQQQLFHWLRNSKQINIWNLTKVNGIHETKQEKNYETKRNFTSDETKRNEISLYLLFQETSEILWNKFVVLLCFVFCETKKGCEMETLSINIRAVLPGPPTQVFGATSATKN